MNLVPVNLKKLRKEIAAQGIFSLAELARRLGCSRWAVYHLHLCPGVRRKVFKEYHV